MRGHDLPDDVASVIRKLARIEVNGVLTSLEDTLGYVSSLAKQLLTVTEPRVPDSVVTQLKLGKTQLLPIHAGDRGDAYSGSGKKTRDAVRRLVNAQYDRELEQWGYRRFGTWQRAEQLRMAPHHADKPKRLSYWTTLALVEDGEVLARGHQATRLARTHQTARLCVEVHPGVDPALLAREERYREQIESAKERSTSIVRGE